MERRQHKELTHAAISHSPQRGAPGGRGLHGRRERTTGRWRFPRWRWWLPGRRLLRRRIWGRVPRRIRAEVSAADMAAVSAADLSAVDIVGASRVPASVACAGLVVCVPVGAEAAGATAVVGPGGRWGYGRWGYRPWGYGLAAAGVGLAASAATTAAYGYDPYGLRLRRLDDGCVPVARRVFDGYGYRIRYVYSCGDYY